MCHLNILKSYYVRHSPLGSTHLRLGEPQTPRPGRWNWRHGEFNAITKPWKRSRASHEPFDFNMLQLLQPCSKASRKVIQSVSMMHNRLCTQVRVVCACAHCIEGVELFVGTSSAVWHGGLASTSRNGKIWWVQLRFSLSSMKEKACSSEGWDTRSYDLCILIPLSSLKCAFMIIA